MFFNEMFKSLNQIFNEMNSNMDKYLNEKNGNFTSRLDELSDEQKGQIVEEVVEEDGIRTVTKKFERDGITIYQKIVTYVNQNSPPLSIKKQLEAAVANENYELAAKLKEQLDEKY